MRKKQPSVRPGGRSEKVRTAVFDAVEALMAKNPRDLPSMAEVAERAGINPTTLYRRWGDATVLAAEVAVERLMRDLPVPDTGSLRGDLMGWATQAAHSLNGKKNLALLRVLASSAHAGEEHRGERIVAVSRRGAEINAVLERAKKRGEPVPLFSDVLELVLAPLYFRVLFFGPVGGGDDVARLVDRALGTSTKAPPAP
jgi:AcrR family transcriptional regulator